MEKTLTPQDIINHAEKLRPQLSVGFRDDIVNSLYNEVERITDRAVHTADDHKYDLDQKIDRIITSPIFGLPIMLLILAAVFWITIVGANVPSKLIADALFFVEDKAAALFTQWGFPWWITGFIWHGVYRGLAWVISVMLPPMAIFFPIFTILEDLGYLPRVAFNLDWLFKRAGAHGKQSLTMAMGFGCNAAGVIATRVIDSPRERLIAILTNNFVPCNGRFSHSNHAGHDIRRCCFSTCGSFLCRCRGCSCSGADRHLFYTGCFLGALKNSIKRRSICIYPGIAPPIENQMWGRILYTSLIDRTIFVLWRAILTAAPAGAVIWILGNITVGNLSLAQHIADFLNPFGLLLGLDGVILLAYIIAIPANEIVVPTMMMVYMGVGMMTDPPSMTSLRTLLVDGHGWTMLTAVNLMLFSLLHNPCATTIMTIFKETKSWKWTTLSVVITLGLAFLVTFITASVARLFGWV